MTVEEKAKRYIKDMNERIGYSSCEINSIAKDAYIAGCNEIMRWRTFDEKPTIHDIILVRPKLYPLFMPKARRVSPLIDLSKKYTHWKPI